MSGLRALVPLCIAIWVALAGVSVRADDSDVARAKKSYSRGMAHYHLREYSDAIAAFEEAYRVHPDPVFLYNIAQALRLSEKYEEALHFYRTYLRTTPRAPNRKEIEARIDELQGLVKAQKSASASPPTGPLTSGPLEKPAAKEPLVPVPVPVPVPQEVQHTVVAPVLVPPPMSEKKSRRWIWGVIAGGVLVVGLGVGLGVGLTVGRPSSNSYPPVSYALDGAGR